MTDQQIFDRVVTIIQERKGEEFILTIEEEFGIEISDEEIDNLHSVADVLAVIKNKI